MRLVRFCSSAFLFSLLSVALTAQSYKTAAGVRIDNGVQLTVQQYLLNNWTAEGILHTSVASDNLGLTLLAEKHQKIIFRGVNLYYGAADTSDDEPGPFERAMNRFFTVVSEQEASV